MRCWGIMPRLYYCAYIGDGSEFDPWRIDYLNALVAVYKHYDLRLVGNVAGNALVWAEPSDVEHAALQADVRVTYIQNAENSNGTMIAWESDLLGMNPGDFNQLRGAMGSFNVPNKDLTRNHTFLYLFLRFIRTHIIQRHIRYVDIFDPPIQLQSDWVAIDTTIRAVSEQRLAEQGYDTTITSVVGATVEDVLIDLGAQDIRANQVDYLL